MWTSLLHSFSSAFANSAALRTAIGFAHVGGLIIGGGTAIAEDRRMIVAARVFPGGPLTSPRHAPASHRVVIGGLCVVMLSGLLLFAADLDTYLTSWVFWTKMGLIAALLANGLVIVRAEADDARAPARPSRLRRAAIMSLALWLLTTLAGAALPNV